MFHLFKSEKGYYFHLKAKNNKVILSSEMYKERRSALKGIAAITHAVKMMMEEVTPFMDHTKDKA